MKLNSNLNGKFFKDDLVKKFRCKIRLNEHKKKIITPKWDVWKTKTKAWNELHIPWNLNYCDQIGYSKS